MEPGDGRRETVSRHAGGIALVRDGRATAELLFPGRAMAGCIVLAVTRDTRGLDLAPEDRFNRFNASPYVAVTWLFEGEARHVADEAAMRAPEAGSALPRLMISGPTPAPVTSWNLGPVHTISVGFYPEAWQALTGIEAGALVGRHVAADEVLKGDMAALFASVFDCGGCRQAFAHLQSALQPLWERRRAGGGVAGSLVSDWMAALALRASTRTSGRSLRQLQRLIKSWTGQSMRDIAGVARMEETYALALRNRGAGLDFARVAAEAGYADQSHMGRDIRARTGMSPARIMQLIETEESYWFYRLIGAWLA